jgi:hypothetical protein
MSRVETAVAVIGITDVSIKGTVGLCVLGLGGGGFGGLGL